MGHDGLSSLTLIIPALWRMWPLLPRADPHGHNMSHLANTCSMTSFYSQPHLDRSVVFKRKREAVITLRLYKCSMNTIWASVVNKRTDTDCQAFYTMLQFKIEDYRRIQFKLRICLHFFLLLRSVTIVSRVDQWSPWPSPSCQHAAPGTRAKPDQGSVSSQWPQ